MICVCKLKLRLAMISKNTFGHIYSSLDQATKRLGPIVMKLRCCQNDPVTWIGSSEIFCINSSYVWNSFESYNSHKIPNV